MEWLNRLQEPKFWLVGIAAAIAAIHLTLLDRTHDNDLFATSALFWLVAGTLIWDKRQTLNLHSQTPASLVGIGLLGLMLFRSSSLPTSKTFLCVLPIIALVGLALLASGVKGLKQYWKEFIIFGFLALFPILMLILQTIDLPILTAKAANLMLYYTGFDVRRQDVYLFLLEKGVPKGRIEVYGACSGLHALLQMLSVSVLFLLMFPLRRVQGIICVMVAVLIGFLVNSARVALLGILNAAQSSSFDFWHEDQGSLVFSVISVGLFGVFCWLTFLRSPTPKLASGDPSEESGHSREDRE
jgi:cyanoexosortase A